MSKKNKTFNHEVTKEDLEINEGALESAGIKEGDIVELTDENMVILTATRNTTTADGTFVKEGEQIAVTEEYAERVRAEGNKNFK